MANTAQYRVSIPAIDQLGFKISPNLPVAGHHWLHHAHPRLFHTSWVEGPHKGLHGKAMPEDQYHLLTTTEDCPEADGYVKQLAAHLGEAVNQREMQIQKTGSDGVENWSLPNNGYIEGQGAHPAVIEQSPLGSPNFSF